MDSNLPCPIFKNKKVLEGSDNVDRISSLPNELISRILSFLSTKYAIRSGVLSNRWKNIWVSLPVLDFDMNTYEKDLLKKFMDFLDSLLPLRLNIPTKKFHFCCSHIFDFAKLYSWLKIIMMSDLDELDLEVGSFFRKLEPLPSSIFIHKTLVVLKLNGKFPFDLPSEVSLPNLKSLFLKRVVYVSDVSIQHMLCGCPVLEDLTIERNGDDNAFNYVISVHSLKRMTLVYDNILPKNDIDDDDEYDTSYDSYDSGDIFAISPKHTLSLHTPNLEYLRFVGQMPRLISVTQMPFLRKADIRMTRFCVKDEDYEIGQSGLLLEATPNVCHLYLSGDAQRNLEEDLCRNGSMFQKLIHLELAFDTWSGPKLLPYFLMVSPNLRSISLPEGISNPGEREQCFDLTRGIIFNYKWIPPNNVPECLLANLKKIEIREVCGAEEEELNLIKYLLNNAMALEKMTVFFHDNSFHQFFMTANCYSLKKEELMNCPRGSPSADLSIFEAPRT